MKLWCHASLCRRLAELYCFKTKINIHLLSFSIRYCVDNNLVIMAECIALRLCHSKIINMMFSHFHCSLIQDSGLICIILNSWFEDFPYSLGVGFLSRGRLILGRLFFGVRKGNVSCFAKERGGTYSGLALLSSQKWCFFLHFWVH